jgi:hypothetical protein
VSWLQLLVGLLLVVGGVRILDDLADRYVGLLLVVSGAPASGYCPARTDLGVLATPCDGCDYCAARRRSKTIPRAYGVAYVAGLGMLAVGLALVVVSLT